MDEIASIKDLKLYVEKIRNNNSICNLKIFENDFSLVEESNNPSFYIFKIKEGQILFNSVITKYAKKGDKKKDIIYYKKNDMYVVEFLGPGIGEIIINIIVNKLFFKSVNPHFLVMLDYSLCDKKGIKINMENLIYGKKKYSNFNAIFIKVTKEIIDSFIIQILYASFTLEYNFSGIHFDLEFRNVFIKEFNDDNYFKAKNMKNIAYFRYKLPSGKSLYLKNYGFILKIGDFDGMVVNNKNIVVINNHSSNADFGNSLYRINPKYPNLTSKEKGFIPGYYLFIRQLIDEIGLYTDIMKDISNIIPDYFKPYDKDIDLTYIEKKDLSNLYPLDELLNSRIFKKYRKKKKDSVIIGYEL